MILILVAVVLSTMVATVILGWGWSLYRRVVPAKLIGDHHNLYALNQGQNTTVVSKRNLILQHRIMLFIPKDCNGGTKDSKLTVYVVDKQPWTFDHFAYTISSKPRTEQTQR